MEKLRELLGQGADYVAAASPREKRMIAFAAGGVVVFFLFILYVSFSSSIRKSEDTLEEKRLAFEKVQRLAQNFGEKQQERELLEAKLRQSPPALMSFVEERAKTEGLEKELGGMSDRGITSGGGSGGKPRESSVEVNLGKVPLDKLGRFLQSVEQSPGVVRVRRLRVRKSSDNKEALDVTLTVSAWQGS
jgi:type II secretory pathway component PulM